MFFGKNISKQKSINVFHWIYSLAKTLKIHGKQTYIRRESAIFTVYRFSLLIPGESQRTKEHRNLPNSLETGDPTAFSPILDSASKYNFPAMDIAGKMIKCL